MELIKENHQRIRTILSFALIPLSGAVASFTIALSHNIYVIYAMRILHGIAVAIIVVGKRAYLAPFLGGYLQASFGWQSNFYFLGIVTLVVVVLECMYGGESLKTFHPFKMKSILEVYTGMIRTADFTVGLVILALCYFRLVVFGMTSPFIGPECLDIPDQGHHRLLCKIFRCCLRAGGGSRRKILSWIPNGTG